MTYNIIMNEYVRGTFLNSKNEIYDHATISLMRDVDDIAISDLQQLAVVAAEEMYFDEDMDVWSALNNFTDKVATRISEHNDMPGNLMKIEPGRLYTYLIKHGDYPKVAQPPIIMAPSLATAMLFFSLSTLAEKVYNIDPAQKPDLGDVAALNHTIRQPIPTALLFFTPSAFAERSAPLDRPLSTDFAEIAAWNYNVVCSFVDETNPMGLGQSMNKQ